MIENYAAEEVRDVLAAKTLADAQLQILEARIDQKLVVLEGRLSTEIQKLSATSWSSIWPALAASAAWAVIIYGVTVRPLEKSIDVIDTRQQTNQGIIADNRGRLQRGEDWEVHREKDLDQIRGDIEKLEQTTTRYREQFATQADLETLRTFLHEHILQDAQKDHQDGWWNMHQSMMPPKVK